MAKNKYEQEVLKSLGKLDPKTFINIKDCHVHLFDEDDEELEKFSKSVSLINFNVSANNVKENIIVALEFESTIFSYTMLKSLNNQAFSLNNVMIKRFAEAPVINNKGNKTDKLVKYQMGTYNFKVENIVGTSLDTVELTPPSENAIWDNFAELEGLQLVLECSIIEIK